MLKALVRTQLQGAFMRMQGISRRRKKAKAANKVLVILIAVYIIGALSLSIGALFYQLAAAYVPTGLSWLYFSIGGIFSFVMGFIGSVFLAQQTLFSAKDNDLLLSMPIPPGMILLSRMLSLYLMTLFFQSVILLPAMVVFFIWGQPTVMGTLFFLLASFLLPLMVLSLSCLLGWLLAVISVRLKRKNLIVMILSLGFLAAYFYGYSKLMSSMNNLASMGMELSKAVQHTIFPAFHFGQAAMGSLASLLIFSVCAVLPFGIVFFALSKTYKNVLTSHHAIPKAVYRGGSLKASRQSQALVRKEWRRLMTSPMYLLNSAIGLFMMLALPILLLVSKEMQQVLEAMIGLQDAKGILAVAAVSFLAATVFISAPSISLEGKSLWVLQSLPLRPMDVLMAKAKAHVLITMAAVILCSIALGFVLKLSLPFFILLLALPFSISIFSALLGLALNLRFPKLNWNNEMEPVKQSMSTFLSMSLSFLIVGGLAALYAFVLLPHLDIMLYLVLCTVFFLMMSGLLYLRLQKISYTAWQALSEA